MDLDNMTSKIDQAFEDAHKDYEERRKNVILNLQDIQKALLPLNMEGWIDACLDDAINFIKEREV